MKWLVWFAGALLAPHAGGCAQTLSGDVQAKIQQFRARQAEILRGPNSALGMVALEKLRDGDTTIGSSPGSNIPLEHAAAHVGIVRLHGERIEFLPPPGGFPKDLTIGGRAPVADRISFDADGTSPVFVEGSVNFVLRHKFGFFLVGRDTHAPALLSFQGLRWYAPNARFRIVARWKPWPRPRVLRVANVLGQVNEEASYGVAEFSLKGRTYQLEPSVFSGREKPLFFVFKDWTSHTTTYGGGRFLDARMPDHGLSSPGSVVLDFNMARNPLCAFSVHTSCPIPPVGNRMAVNIPAGEKRYQDK